MTQTFEQWAMSVREKYGEDIQFRYSEITGKPKELRVMIQTHSSTKYRLLSFARENFDMSSCNLLRLEGSKTIPEMVRLLPIACELLVQWKDLEVSK